MSEESKPMLAISVYICSCCVPESKFDDPKLFDKVKLRRLRRRLISSNNKKSTGALSMLW